MRNNFLSKAYGGVTVARRKLNGLGLPRQWKVMTSTLLLLFTLAIGNVLADTFTASEIAAKSGDVNVGTTKNHVTVSSLGITSTTNTQIWKDGSTAKNEAAVVLSAEPTSSGDTYNKSASFVEIRAERGYALGSTISVRGGSTQDGAKLAVIVYWDGEASPTFTSYDATNLSLGGKKQTSNPSDINLTVPEGTRTARIYKKVKVTDATNLISGNASSSKGNGYAAIVHVIATAVLSPEIDGVSQMFNDETITLTGYPAGGSWDVVSGPGAIASDGKLTASGNGTIRVSYTKDDKTGYKDITAAATKQITFDFTAGVLPTVSGFTLTNLSATFDGANGLKMGSNGQGVRISSTTYDFTNAIVSAKASSTSKKISYNLHANAVDVTNDPEFATVGTSFTEYNKDINSQIFTVFRSGGSTTNFNYIILTVKKHVAAATYTLTLNPAGGTIDPVPSGWTYDDVNGKYIKANVEDGSSVDLLDLTRSGYLLDGWKDGENADYTSPVTIDGADLTLTAQWAQTYAVTYVPNNGVLPAETMTDNNAPYKAGDEVTLLANTFTAPENKEFDEWVATYNDGEVKTLTITAGKFTMPAYPVTVTATWKDACALAPTVSATTLGTTSYTTQVVNCAGISVLGSAGCTISEYGFVYGTTTAPTISDNKKALTGDYTVINTAFAETTLTGLAANTKYYVRAYATNSFGTAYGDESSFTTLTPLGNVLVVAKNAGQTSDAITALRDNGFLVTVSTPNDSRDYTGIDLVVLDESLDGSLAQTSTSEASTIKGANIPLLNLKAFFYTKTNRWNWGSPVNGTATNEIANISEAYCNAQSHPIFTGLTIGAGGAIDLIDPAVASGNTLQGVTTNTLVEGKEGYTLATSGTGITFIHELTPSQRGVDAKYLMIAISNNAKDNLSADGEKLIVNAAKYLVGSTAWTPVLAPVTTGITATPAASYSEGDNIALSISATNVDAETTYTWYKGATLDAAKAAGAIQTAKTAVEGGTSYAKASCEVADAGIYWCVISAGCEVASSLEVTVTTCTKPGTPDNLAASNLAYTTADLSWDAADNSDGYKISIIKKDDESVIVDWTDNATTSYAATGLTQGTEYTFKVKAKGATSYCEFGLEATVDFTTTAPSVADLVTISDDYTFTPSVNIPAGTLSADSKFFAAGTGDCDISGGKMRVKTNRALAFKVAAGARIKVTFATSGSRQIQLGNSLTQDANPEGNYHYGYSTTSPYTFDDVTTGGVVYLTAHDNQLYFSKIEIFYPHTVTYDLNGGTGDPVPTQASKYVGETFTAHDGVTGITAPATKEFDKWVDQDAADVAAGTTYTMPAENVTLTAQWRNETVKYSVTYDLDDYTSGVAPTETDKAAGDVFAIKAAPSRTGYAFMGWLCDIDAHTYQATNNYTMTAAPTTFTAVWKQEFQVTFNVNGHGDPIAPQDIVDGGKVTKPADPSESGWDFGGWYKEAACTNAWDFATDVVTEATELFAKWTTDPCPTPSSLSKVVLTSATDGTVTGDNGNEYAGEKVIGGLADDSKEADITGDAAAEHGYKLNNGGAIVFATLKKGEFQAGDRVTVGVIYKNTNRAVDESKNILTIYAGSDKDHTMEIATLTGVSDPGFYTYRLKAADVAAINAAGYKGIGVFRASDNGENHSIYSVEIKGCREWAIFHTLTFKNIDGTATIAAEPLEEGAYASTVAPAAPKIAMKRFIGWSEDMNGTLVELTSYTITTDKILYAVYEDIVCPTSGTVYKFEIKDELSSENLPTSTDKDMSSYITATGDGYLTYTATANNKATINSDGTIQMKDASAAYLKVELECALAAGDQIRAHITGNPMRVQVAATYDSGKDLILAKDDYTFVDITSAMEGKQVLYITRSSNGNANLADFEIYRRPVATGTTLADLTIRQGQSKTPVMTLVPSADARVTSQVWEIVGTPTNLTGAAINPATGAITTGTLDDPTSTGSISVKVTLNGSIEATCTATVVGNIDQQDVTKSTVWDWHNTGATANIQLTNDTDPKKNENFVLANVAVNNNDEFESDKLAVEGEHMVRDYNKTNPYFQGQLIQFHTTVAGVVRVKFAHTGDATAEKPARELYINGVATGDSRDNATPEWSNYIEVPAGDVSITAHYVNLLPAAAQQYIRVFEIEFLAVGHERTLVVGDLGTVCLPNASIARGVTVYEYKGADEIGKIVFDELGANELLDAGKPYIFQVNETHARFYYNTDPAVATPDNSKALKGNLGAAITFQPGSAEAENVYFVKDHAFWMAKNTGVKIGQYRAYLQMNEVSAVTSSPAPGRRRITLGVQGEQVATGLENGELNEAPRKVLINGELFILRGEKMYDAKGQLVK